MNINTMPTIESLLNLIYTNENQVGTIDHATFEPFIRSIINGDVLIEYLVIPATIGKEEQQGILVYILTNVKLVKVTIDSKRFSSNSAYLNQIVRVDKTINQPAAGEGQDMNNVLVSVEFPEGRFGLRYPANTSAIDNFFIKVEETVRNARVPKNG